jgi:hypothetical protein
MYHLQLNVPRVATSNAQYLMVRDCAMEGRTCVVPNAPRLIETHSLWCPAIPSLSNSSHVPALTYTVLKGYWHMTQQEAEKHHRNPDYACTGAAADASCGKPEAFIP